MINKILQIIHKVCDVFHIDYKFVKFLFVGGINTLFGYSMYALFIFLGFHYSIASLFSTILGVMFNFFTTGKIVFGTTDIRRIIRFIFVYILTYSIGVFLTYLYTLLGGENLYIIGAVLLLPMSFLSFLLMKYFVFKEKHNEKN